MRFSRRLRTFSRGARMRHYGRFFGVRGYAKKLRAPRGISRAIRRYRRITRNTIGNRPEKFSREFLWGSIETFQDGATPGTNGVRFRQPGNVNASSLPTQILTPFTPVSGSAGLLALGASANFSVNDMPASAQAFVRQFNFYKLKSVTLRFKPRWNNTGQDTTQQDDGAATLLAGGGGAPRLYLHTQHDANKVMNEPILFPDDILKFSDHTVYDLTQQRRYHIKPSVTLGAYGNNVGPGTQPLITGANAPKFNQWIDSSAGAQYPTASTNDNEILHQGVQIYMEWENPPLPTVVAPPPGTVGALIIIYATYVFELKTLEE